jgi:hypothetical protein
MQMQNAADAAALEGLRNRDATPTTTTCNPTADPNLTGRCAAQTLGDEMNAGPTVEMTAGIGGSIGASQIITSAGPVTPPMLQTNATNEQYGDMVSGTYCPQSQPSVEYDDYSRNDFNSTCPSVDPPPSFLVRLRRTNNPQNLDDVAGVSKNYGTIPFLFGLGTTIPRPNGVTVRATAIANAYPALRVGAPIATPATPGMTTASLNRMCWDALPPSVATDPSPLCVTPFASPANTVGDPVTTGGTSPADTPVSNGMPVNGYLPIFDISTSQVVGFGFVNITGGMVTRMDGHVATANATAVVPSGFTVPGPGLLTATTEGALLAPTLVR